METTQFRNIVLCKDIVRFEKHAELGVREKSLPSIFVVRLELVQILQDRENLEAHAGRLSHGITHGFKVAELSELIQKGEHRQTAFFSHQLTEGRGNNQPEPFPRRCEHSRRKDDVDRNRLLFEVTELKIRSCQVRGDCFGNEASLRLGVIDDRAQLAFVVRVDFGEIREFLPSEFVADRYRGLAKAGQP
ncbi:MAG TPA: hypothetical protein VGG72_20040 [Bryobacteraceae bacterium]